MSYCLKIVLAVFAFFFFLWHVIFHGAEFDSIDVTSAAKTTVTTNRR